MKREIATATLGSVLAVGLTLGWLGCETFQSGEAEGPIAARLGDEVVTVAEVDAFIKDDLFERETRGGNPSRMHEVRSQALERLVGRRAVEQEAERRGLSVEALLDAELTAMAPVSGDDITDFYEANSDRMRGASLDQVAPQIRDHLDNERRKQVVDAIVEQAGFDLVLEQPRVAIRSGGPSFGPEDARVTIVEYSDFQCPFCQRAGPVLKNVAAKFPDEVKVIYRHFPLDSIHPRARAGAEASACAADGGRFWEYHDLLFANPRALADDDLRGYAKQLGLDPETFDECFRSRRHKAAVEADAREAVALGITGTPSFVVNGVLLFGLQTEEALEAAVRQELKRGDSES